MIVRPVDQLKNDPTEIFGMDVPTLIAACNGLVAGSSSIGIFVLSVMAGVGLAAMIEFFASLLSEVNREQQ